MRHLRSRVCDVGDVEAVGLLLKGRCTQAKSIMLSNTSDSAHTRTLRRRSAVLSAVASSQCTCHVRIVGHCWQQRSGLSWVADAPSPPRVVRKPTSVSVWANMRPRKMTDAAMLKTGDVGKSTRCQRSRLVPNQTMSLARRHVPYTCKERADIPWHNVAAARSPETIEQGDILDTGKGVDCCTWARKATVFGAYQTEDTHLASSTSIQARWHPGMAWQRASSSRCCSAPTQCHQDIVTPPIQPSDRPSPTPSQAQSTARSQPTCYTVSDAIVADAPWQIMTRSRARTSRAPDNPTSDSLTRAPFLHQQDRPSIRHRNRLAVLGDDTSRSRPQSAPMRKTTKKRQPTGMEQMGAPSCEPADTDQEDVPLASPVQTMLTLEPLHYASRTLTITLVPCNSHLNMVVCAVPQPTAHSPQPTA